MRLFFELVAPYECLESIFPILVLLLTLPFKDAIKPIA
jgi:hypothetical protein